MSWCGVEGHDAVVDKFRTAIERGRLASTFLFVGPSGIGKKLFALRLAQSLQCPNIPDVELGRCGRCESCVQVDSNSHPDVELIQKPDDRAFIPVDKFIGDKEHRRREGLVHWIGLKPAYTRRKVAIIDDADFLNQEGANCLLKTLEEPPSRSVLILIGTSLQRQLPTIRSRCQIIRFSPLTHEFIASKLLEQEIVNDIDQANSLATESEGSLDRAIDWSDDDLKGFQEDLYRAFESTQDSLAIAKFISKFVEAAGKEAPPRRARLKKTIEMTIRFLRRSLVESPSVSNVGWSFGIETTTHQIERCIDADLQVSQNANLATLIDCWVDDLLHPVVVD